MRGLVLTVSFVALAGTAFAGEPQKSNTQQPVVASAQTRAPQKMTDQQLGKVVAGSSNNGWLVTNRGGHSFCVASHAGGGQAHGAGSSTVLVGPCV